MLLLAPEKLAQVLLALLFRGTRHQNVTEISVAEVVAAKYTVNETLKGQGSVLQAERHPGDFVEAERGGDGHFRDVRRLHGYFKLDLYKKSAVPCSHAVKLWICGIGYRSGKVALLTAR